MEQKENRFPIFQDRFRQLIGNQDDDEFGKKVGISRQTVGHYKNGKRIPDIQILHKIASKCNVSADWLIGLTNDPSRSPCAVDDLGITPNAVGWILKQKQGDPENYISSRIDILNLLLESAQFNCLFEEICDYYFELKAQSAYEKLYNMTFPGDDTFRETTENTQAFRNGLRVALPNLPAEIEVKEWLLAILEDKDDYESMRHAMLHYRRSPVKISDTLKYGVSLQLGELMNDLEEKAKEWDFGNASIKWGDLNGND